MQKFNRFIDSNNRLLIITAIWHKWNGGKPFATSVDILEVAKETERNFPYQEVERWIKEEIIKQVK